MSSKKIEEKRIERSFTLFIYFSAFLRSPPPPLPPPPPHSPLSSFSSLSCRLVMFLLLLLISVMTGPDTKTNTYIAIWTHQYIAHKIHLPGDKSLRIHFLSISNFSFRKSATSLKYQKDSHDPNRRKSEKSLLCLTRLLASISKSEGYHDFFLSISGLT